MHVGRELRRTAIAAVALSVGMVAVSGSAMAKDGDVEASGRCSGRSTWKLKGGARDGGIETEFEVDSNVRGQLWSVRITDNGVQVFTGARTTVGPSGSFDVERRIANRPGDDRIVGVAVNGRTGERCSGAITV